MPEPLSSLDINDVPVLARLAEEVRTTGRTRVLRQEAAGVAVEIRMAPQAQPTPKRVRKTGLLTKEDSLWNIVGMASSGGPGDVSENKHKYLLEGYLATHR